MSDLAQKLAAHPRWRWLPGMLALHTGESGETRYCVDDQWPQHYTQAFASPIGVVDFPSSAVVAFFVPVLDDPATAGCLLAMVRDDTSDCVSAENWHVSPPGTWAVVVGRMPGGRQWHGATLGEACAAALLALWGPAAQP